MSRVELVEVSQHAIRLPLTRNISACCGSSVVDLGVFTCKSETSVSKRSRKRLKVQRQSSAGDRYRRSGRATGKRLLRPPRVEDMLGKWRLTSANTSGQIGVQRVASIQTLERFQLLALLGTDHDEQRAGRTLSDFCRPPPPRLETRQ